MGGEDDTRDAEQELASGQSEATPVVALASVVLVIGGLATIALVLVALAYLLA